jgi:hypothetical protein
VKPGCVRMLMARWIRRVSSPPRAYDQQPRRVVDASSSGSSKAHGVAPNLLVDFSRTRQGAPRPSAARDAARNIVGYEGHCRAGALPQSREAFDVRSAVVASERGARRSTGAVARGRTIEARVTGRCRPRSGARMPTRRGRTRTSEEGSGRVARRSLTLKGFQVGTPAAGPDNGTNRRGWSGVVFGRRRPLGRGLATGVSGGSSGRRTASARARSKSGGLFTFNRVRARGWRRRASNVRTEEGEAVPARACAAAVDARTEPLFGRRAWGAAAGVCNE